MSDENAVCISDPARGMFGPRGWHPWMRAGSHIFYDSREDFFWRVEGQEICRKIAMEIYRESIEQWREERGIVARQVL